MHSGCQSLYQATDADDSTRSPTPFSEKLLSGKLRLFPEFEGIWKASSLQLANKEFARICPKKVSHWFERMRLFKDIIIIIMCGLMGVKTAHEENQLEMQESISHAAVILHCQQSPAETINEISAPETSEDPGPISTENTSYSGGWETPTSQPALGSPEIWGSKSGTAVDGSQTYPAKQQFCSAVQAREME